MEVLKKFKLSTESKAIFFLGFAILLGEFNGNEIISRFGDDFSRLICDSVDNVSYIVSYPIVCETRKCSKFLRNH